MPVIATPVGYNPAAPGSYSPVVTNLFEVPVPAKRRSVTIRQAACATVRVQLFSENGDPIDISQVLLDNFTVIAAFREVIRRSGQTYYATATIEDTGENGYVSFDVPKPVVNNPGIYILEVVVTDDSTYPRCETNGEVVTAITENSTSTVIVTNSHTYTFPAGSSPLVTVGSVLSLGQQLVAELCLLISNTLSFTVERGLFGRAENPYMGPPTLAEVRLHLRDFPETNLLLDDYEFDGAEVALASERCVMFFNESMPPISRKFDTWNFPYRYHWLEGVCYYLFTIAANWHRRNRLPYQAGGVSVDDTSKEKEYLQAAAMHERNWKEWAARQKVSLNMEEGFDTFNSDYSYR